MVSTALTRTAPDKEQAVTMDYEDEAKELVQELNQRMGPSPYDIAWLARLRHPDDGALRWPDLLEWLLEHQHPDGSWGGAIPYYHDRIICTLAAAIALRESGHRRRDQAAILRAQHYLWNHQHLLARDHFELVAFELLFPTLLNMAQAAGLDIPQHTYGYGRIQAAKLNLIPPGMLYSPRLSTIHSLEFLGATGDVAQMRQALAGNHSLGNSPATTAYYSMLAPDDERPLNYLNAVRDHQREVIYLYPCRIFELSWVLNNLAFSGLPISEFAEKPVWERLRAELTEAGIGLDATFGIPDGDCTSVTCRLLINAGYDVDSAILHRYENPANRIFRTYDYERNISIGTNIHALEALALMPDYPKRAEVQQSVVAALLAERKYDLYWVDKWHISPYYATSHVVVALLQAGFPVDETAYSHTVDWLLHTQDADGSWGFFDQGTAEETAYVLTALLYYRRYAPVDEDILRRSAAYLQRTYRGPYSKYPELWIGKCLFTPPDIVRAAILAALILYEETFGNLPE